MASLNKVQLIGHLGRDPEIRYTPEGVATTRISLATSEAWKDRDSGKPQERTDWHQVVFWDGLAKVVGEHLIKGSLIHVEGQLRTRKYQKDGQDVYVTEVRATELLMLGGKRKDTAPGKGSTAPAGAVSGEVGADDIPF